MVVVSLEVDPTSGRPATTVTKGNTHHMVLDDGWLTTNQTANASSISYEGVENILHSDLNVMKVSAWWVSCLLILIKSAPDWSYYRKIWHCLRQILLEWFLTQVNVELIILITKKQLMQWKHPSPLALKTARVISFAGKAMVSILGDANGIVFSDYLKNGSHHQWKLLYQLAEAVTKGFQVQTPRMIGTQFPIYQLQSQDIAELYLMLYGCKVNILITQAL